MTSRLDNTCRQCVKKVGNGNSICCSTCKSWHHFRCSGLTKEDFKKHTQNINLNWECPKCIVFKCGKCVKIITKSQSSILCDLCNNWVHKKCSLLGNKDFVTYSQNNTPWFCFECTKSPLPFMALDPKKISKLFDISKALEVKSPSTSILWCNNCNKKNHYPNNGFTCSQCSYIIHVKCSKDASKKNSCLNEMFPYRKIDYEEILDLSYNSNYECNCSQFNKNNILEICTKKLLNLKELNFNKNPIFANKDPNFNLADPVCFSYFLSHEFHKVSKKLKTPNYENFSLLHSNICSVQGNFDKLESLIDHLDYKFDVVALSETWETKGNASFTAGNLPGYQKVEGTKG